LVESFLSKIKYKVKNASKTLEADGKIGTVKSNSPKKTSNGFSLNLLKIKFLTLFKIVPIDKKTIF
jgi:hypothetical protein